MTRPTGDTLPTPPPGLITELANGNCVLFAGSGVGIAAGHPSWADLLKRTIELAPDDTGTSTSPGRRSSSRSRWDRPNWWPRFSTSRMPADLLRYVISSAYAPAPGLGPGPLYDVLGRLPVRGAITVNWETELEAAFRMREPVSLTPYDGLVASPDSFFVLYAYGKLDEGPLVLSAEDFRRAVTNDRDLQLFLGNVLATRTLLFVGTSLDGIEQFMIGAGWPGDG